MSNNRHIELVVAAKQSQSHPKVKTKMQKLGNTLGDLVKLKRQELTEKDATEPRKTY